MGATAPMLTTNTATPPTTGLLQTWVRLVGLAEERGRVGLCWEESRREGVWVVGEGEGEGEG
jgi:hypothetical protein